MICVMSVSPPHHEPIVQRLPTRSLQGIVLANTDTILPRLAAPPLNRLSHQPVPHGDRRGRSAVSGEVIDRVLHPQEPP